MRKYSFVFVCLCLFVIGVVWSVHAQDSGLTFTPAQAPPGSVITIHGSGFTGTIQVLFGGQPAAGFVVISDSELQAVVPSGAHSGKLTIVTLRTTQDDFLVGGIITPTVGNLPTATATITPTAIISATPTEVIEPTIPPTPTPITNNVTPTNTPVPPTATPPATATPAPQLGCIWICASEIMALPASGAAWDSVKAAADADPGPVSLSNQDSNNNTSVMAEALVAVRLNDATMRAKVITALKTIITGNTESGARALALGRELGGYVVSADIINLKIVDPQTDLAFRAKLRYLLTFPTSSGPPNLIACHNDRPNNWGGHCGASRIAVDLYLGDKVDLDKAATVFRGWLGDRAAYASFTYGDLWWQSDPAHPVGLNPVGAMIQGHSVDGAEPEEMRRAGAFTWPPNKTDYAWEGLQGAMAQARMLTRAGYPAWQWQDKALLRAVKFLYGIGWNPVGDDLWQVWIVNRAYGTNYATVDNAGHGKGFGWSSWTDR
jgi:hypothetical protein